MKDLWSNLTISAVVAWVLETTPTLYWAIIVTRVVPICVIILCQTKCSTVCPIEVGLTRHAIAQKNTDSASISIIFCNLCIACVWLSWFVNEDIIEVIICAWDVFIPSFYKQLETHLLDKCIILNIRTIIGGYYYYYYYTRHNTHTIDIHKHKFQAP